MFPPSLIENGRRLIEQLFLSLHTTFRLKRWTSLSNPLDFFLSWPTVTSLSPPSIKLLRLLWHDWAKVSEEEGKGKSMRWGRANVRVVGGLNVEWNERRRRLCEEEIVEREIERGERKRGRAKMVKHVEKWGSICSTILPMLWPTSSNQNATITATTEMTATTTMTTTTRTTMTAMTGMTTTMTTNTYNSDN